MQTVNRDYSLNGKYNTLLPFPTTIIIKVLPGSVFTHVHRQEFNPNLIVAPSAFKRLKSVLNQRQKNLKRYSGKGRIASLNSKTTLSLLGLVICAHSIKELH